VIAGKQVLAVLAGHRLVLPRVKINCRVRPNEGRLDHQPGI
jgi:hypothetical protein